VKKLFLFLIVLGGALAGGVYWYNHSRAVVIRENLFTYAPVEYGTMTDTVSATGPVQPKDVIAVGSEVSGQVVAIYVDVNSVVHPGDPLLKLDNRMARLRLQQAHEAVQSAQADIERATASQDAAQRVLNNQLDLQQKGVGSRTAEDRCRALFNAAKASVRVAQVKKQEAQTAVELAQLGLDKTIVRVPASGESDHSARRKLDRPTPGPSLPTPSYTVIEKKVVLGQMIAPPASAQLFTLATDLKDMEVHAQVAEGDIAKVKKGQRATFTISAYADTDASFPGTVVQRKPMPTNLQGAVYYDTVIAAENAKDPSTGEWRLSPGMTASVDIILREHKNVWKVPTTALNFQLDEAYQTPEARAKLAEWQNRKDADDWKPLWVWDRQRSSPWPVFVRISGGVGDQTGIKDNQFNEVLEWEPGARPKSTKDWPRVISHAPPAHRPGLFEQPTNLKLT
jgi:HlyD family secretion protein